MVENFDETTGFLDASQVSSNPGTPATPLKKTPVKSKTVVGDAGPPKEIPSSGSKISTATAPSPSLMTKSSSAGSVLGDVAPKDTTLKEPKFESKVKKNKDKKEKTTKTKSAKDSEKEKKAKKLAKKS